MHSLSRETDGLPLVVSSDTASCLCFSRLQNNILYTCIHTCIYKIIHCIVPVMVCLNLYIIMNQKKLQYPKYMHMHGEHFAKNAKKCILYMYIQPMTLPGTACSIHVHVQVHNYYACTCTLLMIMQQVLKMPTWSSS